MSNTIDCSKMSHIECLTPDVTPAEAPSKGATASGTGPLSVPSETNPARPTQLPQGSQASYECVNDCVSSLGVTSLVNGFLVATGCSAVPPACPVLVGVAAGAVLGACEAACDELSGAAHFKP